MLPEDLPNCVHEESLGSQKNWRPGGMGMNITLKQYFFCNTCGRIALFFSGYCGNALIIPTEQRAEFDARDYYYIFEILTRVWKDFKEKIKARQSEIETPIWAAACEAVGLPIGTMFADVPDDKKDKFREVYDEALNKTDWLRPREFKNSPLPAQLPKFLSAYVHMTDENGGRTWEPVDHQQVAKLPIP